PVGRISPLQLLMKAGQMRERSSSCQEGKAAQLTGTKPPSSLRGAVSRMDCSDGTRKGCSDMSGPDGVVGASSSTSTVAHEANNAVSAATASSLERPIVRPARSRGSNCNTLIVAAFLFWFLCP